MDLKNETDKHEQESRLIYSVIVAGKSANFADKATRAFLWALKKATGSRKGTLPFKMLRCLNEATILECAQYAKTGNYGKLSKACHQVANANPNLMTVTPAQLERFHGIGPKTSRFFIMWIRPGEEFAALDVHVLRWMRANGYPNAPKSTPPSGRLYDELEKSFIAEARKRGKTARQFDMEFGKPARDALKPECREDHKTKEKHEQEKRIRRLHPTEVATRQEQRIQADISARLSIPVSKVADGMGY